MADRPLQSDTVRSWINRIISAVRVVPDGQAQALGKTHVYAVLQAYLPRDVRASMVDEIFDTMVTVSMFAAPVLAHRFGPSVPAALAETLPQPFALFPAQDASGDDETRVNLPVGNGTATLVMVATAAPCSHHHRQATCRHDRHGQGTRVVACQGTQSGTRCPALPARCARTRTLRAALLKKRPCLSPLVCWRACTSQAWTLRVAWENHP
ncbi:hypothetical protein BCR44DRAFT_1291049 [Catenaria anguillulae PL171]|uniref:Uncharacterized protein n=1 Tax=Catenaria anguillulae PL171 TaxID=765915 RepID=A0A1Y2HC62_9FUNG|nr:hypothetical protein BCR44DRAFT_1291049 [Catenaria anguillulae PL171]